MLAGETNVPTRLCEDQAFALRYGFDGSQYIKNAGYVDFAGRFDEGKIDLGSVMMYPSNAFANPECSPMKMEACPLVAIDRINAKEVGTSWIYANVAPSNGDVAFVKEWYPWEADMKIGGEVKAEVGVREHRFDVGKLRATRGD
jgi:hypothetical protein